MCLEDASDKFVTNYPHQEALSPLLSALIKKIVLLRQQPTSQMWIVHLKALCHSLSIIAGTNRLSHDLRYRTDHDAGMPMPECRYRNGDAGMPMPD